MTPDDLIAALKAATPEQKAEIRRLLAVDIEIGPAMDLDRMSDEELRRLIRDDKPRPRKRGA
jgi:hypothetical protein